MIQRLRFLLLQVRNPDDPMKPQEVRSFARALGCGLQQIHPHDILSSAPDLRTLQRFDLILLGGSGHYSATSHAAWLDRALDSFRLLHAHKIPTFASCWGFQAIARALGGAVLHRPECAELGTHRLRLTESGKADPVFAPLGEYFDAQMGHEDSVTLLPPGATLLASTDLVENQAYCFPDRPMYCTQFHPELAADDMFARVRAYPDYITKIVGLPPERFNEICWETVSSALILPRFVQHVFG